MSVPRAKPWEVSSGTSAAAASGETQIMDDILNNAPAATTSTALPPKPDSLGQSAITNNGGMEGDIGGNPYGSAFGSRYGSMYGSSLGGYGGYGGYGGMGMGMGLGGLGSYGGYGGYGMMNGMGMAGMANGGMGGLAASTQATFQLIESLIGAVGGFAQMLEATYMATQSSFFTMMSVGEQMGNLRNALGSVFGIFTIIKYIKKLLHKITGLRIFKEKVNFSTEEFHEFSSGPNKKKPRISLKPLLIFVAAVFGIPYLLNKLVKALAQQHQMRNQRFNGGMPGGFIGNGEPLDPKSIEFCRALYDFNPEDPNIELAMKQGGLYAVLSKNDPFGKPSQWWKCRSRDGKVGYVPYNYLEVIQRSALQEKVATQNLETVNSSPHDIKN
ncbi:peroxin [Saccharomycopsis crataegensis]|uniref:Peroxisomal membrane protein PEX13 n=1 Tax=Saccharomycopsis crataegensis TaxID=43959 RepID=A0AAV5QT41_9ASCO|nr:peroxin [Saccharomycopsis crataegensis]